MRKNFIVGWILSGCVSMGLFADPAQPLPNSFCNAELAARALLETSFPSAVLRAQTYLKGLGSWNGSVPTNLSGLPAVVLGQTTQIMPVSHYEDARARLTAMLVEFAKGPSADRTAIKISDDQQIEDYVSQWVTGARSGPQVDPDFHRPPLRMSFSTSKYLGTLGAVLMGGVGVIAGLTLPEPPFMELSPWITDLLPVAGVAGATSIVSGLLTDVARYWTKLWTRKDDITIDLQGTARLEWILKQIRSGSYSAVKVYYGAQNQDGIYTDFIFEVIRGRPTLSVFKWKPELKRVEENTRPLPETGIIATIPKS